MPICCYHFQNLTFDHVIQGISIKLIVLLPTSITRNSQPNDLILSNLLENTFKIKAKMCADQIAANR